MVDLLLAVEPCVSSGTLAEITTVRVVSAASAVKAWPIRTRHGAKLAVVAIKAWWTGTAVGVLHVL